LLFHLLASLKDQSGVSFSSLLPDRGFFLTASGLVRHWNGDNWLPGILEAGQSQENWPWFALGTSDGVVQFIRVCYNQLVPGDIYSFDQRCLSFFGLDHQLKPETTETTTL
jgi:hypothetical protein